MTIFLGGSGEMAEASTRLYEILRSAEKSIIIENPYLILTDELEQLFKELISDGVTVSIVTNSLKTTDGILPQAAYLNDSLNILKIGVRLYEFFGDKRLHSKSFVVDDKIAIIGTYNLDPPESKFKYRDFNSNI